MDFSLMTGYEFEDYIAKVLRQQGFEVEQTAYSGDGGTDLIATYKKPLFSGKYIVQCKNYTGLVGQPELRDLYGVVMGESANKGILITPSDFTEQAYSFAEGKQIELINGVILRTIIGDEAVSTDTATPFYVLDGFNRARYEYLRQIMEEKPNEETSYRELFCFLRGYIKDNKVEICNAGLFEEILSVVQRWKSRCYKGKSKELERKMCDLMSADILLICGEVAKAAELLFCAGETYYQFAEYEEFWPYSVFSEFDGFKNKLIRETKNLHFCASESNRHILACNLSSALSCVGYFKGQYIIRQNLKTISCPEDYTEKQGSVYFVHGILHQRDLWLYRNTYLENDVLSELNRFLNWYNQNTQGTSTEYIHAQIECQGSGKSKCVFFSVGDFETDVVNMMFYKEHYFKKTDEEICRELDEVFTNHGFI